MSRNRKYAELRISVLEDKSRTYDVVLSDENDAIILSCVSENHARDLIDLAVMAGFQRTYEITLLFGRAN